MAVEIYPVVHVNEVTQALEQSALAYESGANGVYLIDHKHASLDPLVQSYNSVVEHYPNSFVGVNFLQLSSADKAFSVVLSAVRVGAMARLPDGIWVDDARRRRIALANLRADHPVLRNVQYLGGVAFKYTQTYTDNPEKASAEAAFLAPYVDVVTTSGRETGNPPSLAKIKAMRQVLGDQKLAVASGISAENIRDYSGLLDQLLVSTSLEVEPYSGVFVPKKLEELIELAKAV